MNSRIKCPDTCPRYNEKLCHPCIKGVGPTTAKIMLVGENPGRYEDEEGSPFVGRSGQLLDQIFYEVGLDRKNIFITNSVRCFTNKEDPKPSNREIKLCRFYLEEEIKQIKPIVICALGATALKSVLDKTGITKLKNNVFISEEFNTKVIPTYHPAYILRNPWEKNVLSDALRLAKAESDTQEILLGKNIVAKYSIIESIEGANKVLDCLEKQEAFVFDLETTSLDFLKAKILCIALSWKEHTGVTIPWDLLDENLLQRFKNLFLSNKLKVGQNLKYDLKILKHNGFSVAEPWFDTMLAHHLLDENSKHGLDELVLRYLRDMGEYWNPIEQYKAEYCREHKIKKEDFTYDLLPKPMLYDYACKDANATYRLYKYFDRELVRQNLMDFYKEHVISYTPIVCAMEYKGILIERDKLKTLLDSYEKKIEDNIAALHEDSNIKQFEMKRKKAKVFELEKEYKEKEEKGIEKYNKRKDKLLAKYAKSKLLKSRYPNGPDEFILSKLGVLENKQSCADYIKSKLTDDEWKINFSSGKQLAELFFKDMNIEPPKITDKGNYSTDEEVMNTLSENGVESAKKIVEHRKLIKYASTYIKYIYEGSAADGRLHDDLWQTGTVTGRFSSGILQVIPRDAKDIKECMLADPGYTWVKADLAQAEFRCWAHYANDEKMINDIESGLDIHRKIASIIFRISEDKVSKEQRNVAKNADFGLMYGRGPHAISKQYKISVEEAEAIQVLFFQMYPIATQWLKTQKYFVAKHGYVKTWFGRIRRLPGAQSEEQEIKAEAERQSLNAPIQGQATDMNNGYLRLTLKLAKKNNIDCHPLMTVHDANFLQCRIDQVPKLVKIMQHVVANAYPDFRCEMKLEFEVGNDLGNLKDFVVNAPRAKARGI